MLGGRVDSRPFLNPSRSPGPSPSPSPSPSAGPTPRTLQVAILVVGVHWRSQFEWYAHEKLARKAGVAEAALPLIRAGARSAALRGVLG